MAERYSVVGEWINFEGDSWVICGQHFVKGTVYYWLANPKTGEETFKHMVLPEHEIRQAIWSIKNKKKMAAFERKNRGKQDTR